MHAVPRALSILVLLLCLWSALIPLAPIFTAFCILTTAAIAGLSFWPVYCSIYRNAQREGDPPPGAQPSRTLRR